MLDRHIPYSSTLSLSVGGFDSEPIKLINHSIQFITVYIVLIHLLDSQFIATNLPLELFVFVQMNPNQRYSTMVHIWYIMLSVQLHVVEYQVRSQDGWMDGCALDLQVWGASHVCIRALQCTISQCVAMLELSARPLARRKKASMSHFEGLTYSINPKRMWSQYIFESLSRSFLNFHTSIYHWKIQRNEHIFKIYLQ